MAKKKPQQESRPVFSNGKSETPILRKKKNEKDEDFEKRMSEGRKYDLTRSKHYSKDKSALHAGDEAGCKYCGKSKGTEPSEEAESSEQDTPEPESKVEDENLPEADEEVKPTKKRRGRPKGSKNKK